MFLFKKGEKYIGMDDASGGYPYETDRAFSAKEWSSVKEAQQYQSMFKDEGWTLHEVVGLNLRDA